MSNMMATRGSCVDRRPHACRVLGCNRTAEPKAPAVEELTRRDTAADVHYTGHARQLTFKATRQLDAALVVVAS